MAENSKIQWTDHTFNPWRGCEKVAATLGIWGSEASGARRVVAAESQWRQVEKWNREAGEAESAALDWNYRAASDQTMFSVDMPPRPRVFVASLADVFEDWRGPMVDSHGDRLVIDPDGNWLSAASPQYGDRWLTMADVRARLFRLIDSCPNLDFILLTKRPENVIGMWSGVDGINVLARRNNCWLITSIANQEDADRNIPELLKCRDLVPVLGVSAEPLVGPVNLTRAHSDMHRLKVAGSVEARLRAVMDWGCEHNQIDVDWVIAGGESGPNARPCNVDWLRSLRDQCKEAGVPFFLKQLGSLCHAPDNLGWPQGVLFKGLDPRKASDEITMSDIETFGDPSWPLLKHPKGGDPSEWPEDLRVREFPQ